MSDLFSSFSSIDSGWPILDPGAFRHGPRTRSQPVEEAAAKTRRVLSFSSIDLGCPIFHFGWVRWLAGDGPRNRGTS
jgi:hypothetical protein